MGKEGNPQNLDLEETRMSNQVFADGPFRIDQTFSLPHGSYEILSGADLSEVSMIAPALIEPDQLRADAISTEEMRQSDGDSD